MHCHLYGRLHAIFCYFSTTVCTKPQDAQNQDQKELQPLNEEETVLGGRLELILIAIWRKRLGIQDLPAAEVLVHLKQHAEAGVLLGELERWLHSPDSAAGGGAVDPAQLLAPYRNLTAEDWDREWEATAPGADALGQDG